MITNDLLNPDVIERSAKALFEIYDHKLLASAGFPVDWESQPLTIKIDYRRRARTVIRAALESAAGPNNAILTRQGLR